MLLICVILTCVPGSIYIYRTSPIVFLLHIVHKLAHIERVGLKFLCPLIEKQRCYDTRPLVKTIIEFLVKSLIRNFL
ncbi:Conserved hypothetical protein [Clostridium acetobutylicum EA 2018]|uniref:Uncharacterized protein n=1 Tax=Clostridium acetobutylicum (strain ATCC 824 / DSM 792 / JCM 1419 / IAM 19013 / LMG 5710 / NBRC 13948 / NRRL B-527 / VKM B-1787 / 2291 / W) TaxID=272562 RepID=Q97F40_CLOAB|nr:Hypothetical protein CA_C2913 [Clostridium acetobutylicum ATCC 824]ADZ21957.1 Conserved hypothetical protein [Clostridium acetobutylicum EA 2018]AEI32606.1 hypothetical protein SMB_G2949 [Clostridium acetobutylicum DSM 1731]AWV78733.1 hypothetical protein DK921_01115 [Clostridium acetobutylicum]PSM06693.1 hypothetical protein C7T89_01115 [Clostridium sp. NJ4]